MKDGDIVISRACSVGYSHLIKNPKEAIFASYLIRFRPLIDEKYLAFFIKSPLYWDSISEKSLGIAIPNVNASKLKQIQIPLPPLPEQRRIVTKLEELFTRHDAGVDALKKTQAQLKRYRQSVLKAACEGKLVPNEAELAKAEGRAYEHADVLLAQILKERRSAWEKTGKGAKHKEPLAPDIIELPKLPDGWRWVKLGEIADKINPGFPSGKHNKESQGVPHLRPMNINVKGKIDFSVVKYVQPDSYDSLLRGDVLFNNTNSPELLGKTSYIKDDTNYAYSNHMTRIRFNVSLLNPAWISYNLHNLFLSGFFKMNCTHHVNQASINSTFLSEKVPTPLPPLAEQRRIVAEVERRLSVADEVARTVEQSLAQAQRLRQSILKKAFEGRLVAQDEMDEPAGVLLEKIRLQKQIKQPKKGSA